MNNRTTRKIDDVGRALFPIHAQKILEIWNSRHEKLLENDVNLINPNVNYFSLWEHSSSYLLLLFAYRIPSLLFEDCQYARKPTETKDQR